MANTIVTLFDSATDAQNLVSELTKAGFDKTRINTLTGSSNDNIPTTLTSANVPQEQAQFYAEGVRRGGTLVTLSVEDSEVDRAVEVLDRHNPVDITERAAQLRSSGFSDFNMDQATTSNDVAIPVVEEELRVGKRQVERGGVRLYSRVTERPVEETVTLREEHVNVERRPVNRAVSTSDTAAFKEGTIEMTETSEEVVLDKQARVVEEVVVSKDVVERAETVRDTVRRTDVEVEETGTDTTTPRSKGTAPNTSKK